MASSGRRRDYDPSNWDSSDVPNRCVSAATACLHGLAEAAVLAAGYAPAIGFLHTGKPLSFVYDIADLFKFETVVPVAFEIAGKATKGTFWRSPPALCDAPAGDSFRRTGLLEKLIPSIEEVLAAAGVERPPAPEDFVGPAFPDKERSGDAGHRS